jgi:type I restriction enzyme R subunit
VSGYLEADFETAVLDYFEEIGWKTAFGPSLGPDGAIPERSSYADPLLMPRLRAAVERLNPDLDANALDLVLAAVRRAESADLLRENHRWHQLLVGGVNVSVRNDPGDIRYVNARLIDLRDATKNDYIAINQVRIEEATGKRRADVVAYINGIPIAIFELKRPSNEDTTIESAFYQVETYKREIPALFVSSAFTVIADGALAKMGALNAPLERFAGWRTIDSKEPIGDEVPQIKVLIHGAFDQSRILELIEFFIDWGEGRSGLKKRLATYSQYWGVRAAVDSIVTASAPASTDRRAGIMEHTQGSGKSMELLLVTNRLARMPEMASPTIVILTDRNDLDDQLWNDEFAPSRILPETPLKAKSRAHLSELLARASGGVILTTIGKFDPSPGSDPVLTARTNVVVMADEAHRSQYGLLQGQAAHMRSALPNATYLGFTGTPVDLSDRSTWTVFGDVVSRYSSGQSVEDGATVRMYYESRVARLRLTDEAERTLDAAIDALSEDVSEEEQRRTIASFRSMEAILQADDVVDRIVTDMLDHLERRRGIISGKAMLVGQTRAMCAKFYERIVERHPEWHSDDDAKGRVKVVYTGGPDDKPGIAKHVRSAEAMRTLKLRASNADDELDLIIVCDLWLQGFDSPSVNTMYLVKMMKGHGLFQAVTRPNRPWKDKPAGLIVSYVPVLDALKDAIGLYAKGDLRTVGVDLGLAVKTLLAKHDAVKGILLGHPWNSGAMSATERDAQVTTAAAFLARDPDKDTRFRDQVHALVILFAICGTRDEAVRVKADVEFFVAVRAHRAKFNGDAPLRKPTTRKDLNTAIETLVNGAIEADEVIDVYAAAGAEHPEISLLSDAALASITARKHTSLQIEILRKILRDQIRIIERKNAVRGRLLSEMLAAAVLRYQNRALSDAEVVLELVEMAKELRAESERHVAAGLSEAELAFYDAVIQNDSAVLQLGDETLKAIARELVESIRRSTTLDWRNRESVQAALRVRVKILLKRHDYPPDKEARATELVLEQAQLFTEEMLAA